MEILIKNLIIILQQIADRMRETNDTHPECDGKKTDPLTIKEASERFGVSQYSVRSWARKKMISSVRSGESGKGKILINAKSLQSFLEGKSIVDNSKTK